MIKRVISIFICIMMFTSVAFAASTTFVGYTTTTTDEATTVTATALAKGVEEDDVKLYTAVYDAQGNLVTAKGATSDNGALLKNSVSYEAGQNVKSFAWEGANNMPVALPATYGKTSITESDVEISFGGKSFSDYVGSALAFDGTDHVAEYTISLDDSKIGADGNITIPVPEVKVRDNAIAYTVNNDRETLSTTITFSIGREVSYDNAYTSMPKETYGYAISETVVLSYEMTMFTEDMIINGGMDIDFNGNQTFYDNIYEYTVEGSSATQSSPAIEGKTAVLSALSVDGVPVEGFSPDVFTYTVKADPAQVSIPSVSYVVAGNAKATMANTYTLPGKTVVTVTEGDAVNTYEINYAFDAENFASNVARKDTSIANSNPLYAPGGMQVGVNPYGDRTNAGYRITEIKDSRLVGADLIRGSVTSYNGNNSAIYEGPAISDWITFDAARGVTVVILAIETKGKTNFENNSYIQSTDNDGFIKTYTTEDKVFKYAYTRHFAANTQVTIPNAAEDAGHTILVALLWDNWSAAGRDITITADKFSKATIVALVPKDKSRDTIVTKDENDNYIDVIWTADKSTATDAYDYERDDEGNILYNGYKSERATGRRYNDQVVTMKNTTTTAVAQAFKQFTENDGHYVYGSQVATNRWPKSGNRMSIMNIPDEYEGSNGIVYTFNGDGHDNVELSFSVNDNISKVVVMSIDAISNLKANGEAVFTHSVPATADTAYYKYQGVTSGKPATAEFTMSYHIAKGNMYDHDIASESSKTVSEGYTYYITRRAIADFLKLNVVTPNPEKMSDELYKIATTAERDSWKNHKWFLGEIVFEEQGALVENLTFLGPKTHTAPKQGESNVTVEHKNPDPMIMDFTFAAYSDRIDNVSSASGNKAGQPLSYPAWLEASEATYIAGAYEWTSLPGCYATVFEDTKNATDWYSFEVTEDATVMLFIKNAPANFWATEADGWSKSVLEGEDMINICRTKTRTDCFDYNNLFVKNVKKGNTVVIKSPMVKQCIPLVFVKPVK